MASMDVHRHRLMVLDQASPPPSRTWRVDELPAGPHQEVLLVCGCCEAPLVYGWQPEELTAVVQCADCGCTCAASAAGAIELPHHVPSRGYVRA